MGRKRNLSGFSRAALGPAQDPGGANVTSQAGLSAPPTPSGSDPLIPRRVRRPPPYKPPRPRSRLRPATPPLSRLSHPRSTATDPSPGCSKGLLSDTLREANWGPSSWPGTRGHRRRWDSAGMGSFPSPAAPPAVGEGRGRWAAGRRESGIGIERRDPRSGGSHSP